MRCFTRSGDDGLESHLPPNALEQEARVPPIIRPGLDGVAQPLVDIPVGQANESRSKGFRLEDTVTAFAGAKLERRRPRGVSSGKENLDIQNSSGEVLGKRGIKNADPDISNDKATQLTDQLQGDTIGNPTAFGNYGRGGQPVQGDVESVGMETSEPDSSKGAKSRIWAAVKKGATICEVGSKWVIGSNSTLCFWHDKWLSMGTIRSLVEGPLQRGEENLLVKDVICSGRWDFSNISFDLNELVRQAIVATPLRRVAERGDHKCWISTISLVSSNCSTNGDLSGLVDDCREMLLRMPQAKMSHCYREANCCADALARIGASSPTVCNRFATPPPSIAPLLFSDFVGLSRNRACPRVSDVLSA
ncbi:hypothetical protein CFP56_037993 [Quercus suber]|uniref:RNase H type-1 domain-containing protein n=1 Tax=Quercus suber TaxID=58331 RepID=A0AAW0LMR1_QUESU